MRKTLLSLSMILLVALLAACVSTSSDDNGDDVEDEATEEVAADTEEDPTATSEPADEEPTATAEEEAEPTEAAEDDAEPTATAEDDGEEATPPADEEDEGTPPADDDEGDGDANGDGPTEHIIDMVDPSSFDPSELEVNVGDTITFVNAGNINHTSTLDPEIARDASNAVLPDGAETWDSEAMEPGDEFSITLEVPGEYVYFCRPHEALGMVGTITVTGDDVSQGDSEDETDDYY